MTTANEDRLVPLSEATYPALTEVKEYAHAVWSYEEALRVRVKLAREQGASWAEVAAALGVTRQAAQQKYGKTSA